MNKQNLIIWFVILVILALWIIIWQSLPDDEVSELNKKIDIQERLISNNCWVCYWAKVELENLYLQKKSIMSGFTQSN